MLSLSLMLALLSCTPDDPGFARALQIDSLDQTIGGPKALAQPGDFLLENDQLRVAILGARNSMGPGLYGGSLVDADRQWVDPTRKAGFGYDQLAELFPTGNLNITQPFEGDITIVADGSDGQAIVRVEGQAEPFLTLLGALWALVGAPDFHLSTDYIVEPGQSWVTMRTTASYGGSPPTSLSPIDAHTDSYPLLSWAVETGLVLGDFYLQGGSVDVFAPGIGFDEDGAVFRAQERGENTFTAPFQFDFVAGVGDGVSYGIAAAEGQLYVPLFTASQTAVVGGAQDGNGTPLRFPPGTGLTYERYFFVGKGDVGSVVDGFIEARGIPYGTVTGTVIEANTATALSGIDVFVYPEGDDMPWSQWRTDVDPEDNTPDGFFGGKLPVGNWEIQVHDRGRPQAGRISVQVREGKSIRLQLEAPRTGVLNFTVEDEGGRALPSKVSIFRTDGPTRRDPILGDGFIAGDPELVVFADQGQGEVALAPGTYRAIASRGVEYELDISEPFVISRNAAHLEQFMVERSVNTDGWISADLHVHSQPSHDSGVSKELRIRTMVAEGVEFFAATDHDVITDFAPTVEAMGLSEWIQTAPGNETTTVELGHFLSFPLQQDWAAESGGAFDWTGMTAREIVDDLRAQGQDAGLDPVVYIGHPRDGILGYFDQYGFDPYAGEPGFGGQPGVPVVTTPTLSFTNPLLKPDMMSWDFDGLEVLNGKRVDLIRTPTQRESDRFAAGDDISIADLLERTPREQRQLQEGVLQLAYGIEGNVDDWFTLLNLGHRFTALGNSDTHGTSSIEAGCPRNFIMADTDDPAFLDDQAVADAVREHRVVASYGPFVRMWVGRMDDQGAIHDREEIGGTLQADGSPIALEIEVQAPSWMHVTHAEVYQNGTLIERLPIDTVPFYAPLVLEPTRDSWYVVAVTGDSDLAPVFTPVEIPYIELQVVVTDALSGIDSVSALLSPAIPIPRMYPILPYAITNPVWVDVNGGDWQPPGLPDWLQRPVAPAE